MLIFKQKCNLNMHFYAHINLQVADTNSQLHNNLYLKFSHARFLKIVPMLMNGNRVQIKLKQLY